MVNQPIHKSNKMTRTIEDITRDIRNIVYTRKYPTIDQIYIISSPQFEPERYARLDNLFINSIGVSPDNLTFICPTYKQTIPDEIMTKYTSSRFVQRVRPIPMKKSEISLFFNYKAVLEHIDRNYKDGQFMIFESDVFALDNISGLNEFLKCIDKHKENWNIIHFGFDGGPERDGIFREPYCMSSTPYRNALSRSESTTKMIEDITNKEDPFRLIRKFHTRCCDSFLWNYSGIVQFLKYMNTDTNYSAPFDYYMTNMFETNHQFKHYWSTNHYFIQGSNHGLEKSTIQNDTM